MKFHYAYILQSKKDGKFYVGSTNSLKRRFQEHQRGAVDATKHRRPLELVYYEAIPGKIRAEKRELYFKTAFGKAFIKKQIGLIGTAIPVE